MSFIIEEFKKFITRGSIIDMSIGLVIGASFNNIVNSFVKDILMPPIGLILGGMDFSNLFIVLKEGKENIKTYASLQSALEDNAIVMSFGVFINSIVSFFITSLALFMIIKSFNKVKEKIIKDKKISQKECPYCFSSININATRCPNCTSNLK